MEGILRNLEVCLYVADILHCAIKWCFMESQLADNFLQIMYKIINQLQLASCIFFFLPSSCPMSITHLCWQDLVCFCYCIQKKKKCWNSKSCLNMTLPRKFSFVYICFLYFKISQMHARTQNNWSWTSVHIICIKSRDFLKKPNMVNIE